MDLFLELLQLAVIVWVVLPTLLIVAAKLASRANTERAKRLYSGAAESEEIGLATVKSSEAPFSAERGLGYGVSMN